MPADGPHCWHGETLAPGRVVTDRRATRLRAGALVAVLVLAACSGGDDDAGEPIAPVSGESVTSDSSEALVPTPDAAEEGDGQTGGDAETAPSTTEFDLSAQPSTPAIEPVPETGVPGIDSGDVFCRAWSEFAGSFQALGLVSAIGDRDDGVSTRSDCSEHRDGRGGHDGGQPPR